MRAADCLLSISRGEKMWIKSVIVTNQLEWRGQKAFQSATRSKLMSPVDYWAHSYQMVELFIQVQNYLGKLIIIHQLSIKTWITIILFKNAVPKCRKALIRDLTVIIKLIVIEIFLSSSKSLNKNWLLTNQWIIKKLIAIEWFISKFKIG